MSANKAIRLPDCMVSYPAFVLTSGRQGSESLMCVATTEDPMTRMPQELNVEALTPIQGLCSLNEMRAYFEVAAGANKMASQTLEWHILPVQQAAADDGQD